MKTRDSRIARRDLGELVAFHAGRAGVAPELLLALVLQESGGDPWAYNPEPRYRYFWNVSTGRPFRRVTAAEIASETPPADFPSPAPGRVDADAEWWAQQASFGLAQVMGAVGRELGFDRDSLLMICKPGVGLELGARHLANMIRRFGERDGLAAYNAGPGGRRGERGQGYAASVLARMEARR